MKFIPTTATAIDKIKSHAKFKSKSEKIPLSIAREHAAVQAGYLNWHHALHCFKRTSTENRSSDILDDSELTISKIVEFSYSSGSNAASEITSDNIPSLKMEKLKNDFIKFINSLNRFTLEEMCASHRSIGFDRLSGFYDAPTDYIMKSGNYVAYNSDGQADYPITSEELKQILISDAEDLLQEIYYAYFHFNQYAIKDNNKFDFTSFYVERCKYYNRSFNAPPGIHLPEAGAMALSDFIDLAKNLVLPNSK